MFVECDQRRRGRGKVWTLWKKIRKEGKKEGRKGGREGERDEGRKLVLTCSK